MWKMGKANSGLMSKRKRIWKKEETKTVFSLFRYFRVRFSITLFFSFTNMGKLDVENGKS